MGNTAFQGIQWFGEPVPLQHQDFLVFFQVYGCGAYGFELFHYLTGDVKVRL
jgi:hypothetical protein